MGPLKGLTIIEIAGIGPGPFRRHVTGGHGRRRHSGGATRRQHVHRRTQSQTGLSQSQQALHQYQPEEPEGVDTVLHSAGKGRRPAGGKPTRRHGAAWPGPGCLPGTQSGTGLRPHDRLGPGGPNGAAKQATTSTISPSAEHCIRLAGPVKNPPSRSTWWAISVVAA